MVKTLLSTHADTYTRTNTHVRTRTNTPQQIYCWQLRVQCHSMNTSKDAILPLVYRTYTHTPTYAYMVYARVPCEGSIPVVRGRSALLPDHYSASD